LAADFQRSTGHTVTIVPGATGKLYAQIRNGAPYHVFLSADAETPRKLVQEGLAVAGSSWTYATGRLVLWSPRPGVVDPEGEVLARSDLRVAIADPKTAPYGAAAMRVLQKRGLWQSLQGRLVQGESIAQTYQFVSSGNATVGFLALSQVMQNGRMTFGSGWLVPAQWHPALQQDAVLLQRGRDSEGAQAFLDFLRSDSARRVMQQVGYE
jgi:molybdate transport system substrate-binding protein